MSNPEPQSPGRHRSPEEHGGTETTDPQAVRAGAEDPQAKDPQAVRAGTEDPQAKDPQAVRAGAKAPETAHSTLQDLKRDLEGLLFAAGRPLAVEEMVRALSYNGPVEQEAVEQALNSLALEFPVDGGRGFELARLAGGWVFRTTSRSAAAVAALFDLPEDVERLSAAAMECLSIVAYLQPVSRPQIAEIRGVNSDSPMRTLLDRELITEVGRDSSGSGAILYGTTPRFEAMFGLSGLDELPPLEGFALTEEEKANLRRRFGLLIAPE